MAFLSGSALYFKTASFVSPETLENGTRKCGFPILSNFSDIRKKLSGSFLGERKITFSGYNRRSFSYRRCADIVTMTLTDTSNLSEAQLASETKSETVLKVSNLKKSYGQKLAVDGISFEVKAGEVFGLLGPNAAGKSTTIKSIVMLMRYDGGSIEVCGTDTRKDGRLCKERIGYIAQDYALDKMLTGREHLRYIGGLYHLDRAYVNEAIEYWIQKMQLGEYIDKLTEVYSGGFKKRLDIVMGLLHNPKVLVLDEPTNGLDIESRRIVWDLLRELKESGMGIVLTSHYLEEVDALADRVAIIDRGRIIAQGTPSELKDSLGGDRITLRIREFTSTEEAEIVCAELRNLEEVTEIFLSPSQGNAINLVVTADPLVLSKVQAAVRELGLPLFSISQSRPSLDDVYLRVTGQSIAEAEAANFVSRDFKAEKKGEGKAKK